MLMQWGDRIQKGVTPGKQGGRKMLMENWWVSPMGMISSPQGVQMARCWWGWTVVSLKQEGGWMMGVRGTFPDLGQCYEWTARVTRLESGLSDCGSFGFRCDATGP